MSTDLIREVTRQALMEYLSRRYCYENRAEHISDGLWRYVGDRYSSHPESFREYKHATLIPRIAAAFAALEALS